MHPQPHPCRGAATEVTATSERPGMVPLTRPSPSPIPMLPCTTTTLSKRILSAEISCKNISLAKVRSKSL